MNLDHLTESQRQAVTTDSRKAMQARCDAAREGPWKVDWDAKDGCYKVWAGADRFNPVLELNAGNPVWTCDDVEDGCPDLALEWRAILEFAAHARTDLPKCLDEIERLRAVLPAYKRYKEVKKRWNQVGAFDPTSPKCPTLDEWRAAQKQLFDALAAVEAGG